MSEDIKFCEGEYGRCVYLSISEKEQQTKKYEDHICKKFKKRVYHGECHPRIKCSIECDGYSFKAK